MTTTLETTKPKSSRGNWVVVIVVVLAAALGGWLLTRGIDATETTPSLLPPVSSSATITWQNIEGFRLPVSSVDGPRCISRTQASCFRHSPAGAALAAAHLLARTLSFVGPDVFTPTISSQVVGTQTEALRRLTEQTYADESKAAGITPPDPIPTTPGWMAGYRIDPSPTSDAYIVRLLVRDLSGGDGSMGQITVDVEWHDGDWRVVAPQWGDWSTAAAPVAQIRPGEWLSFDDLGQPGVHK